MAASDPAPVRRSVAVVDNHDYVRDGVLHDLEQREQRYGPLSTYATVEEVPLDPPPDLVVLDLHLGRDDSRSTPAIPALVAAGAKVVLYTSEERPVPLRQAQRAGISGLALKNDGRAALLQCLDDVAASEFVCSSVLARALVTDTVFTPHLSARLVEVLEGLADGLTRRQAAARMGISEDTFGDYLKGIRERYQRAGRQVTNAQSLVREATHDGYLE